MKFLMWMFLMMPGVANAIVVGEDNYGKSGPDTECPSGYIATVEEDVSLFYVSLYGSCPTGTVLAEAVGDTVDTSCLASDILGECYMFVPEGKKYVDDSGTYGFTNLFAME